MQNNNPIILMAVGDFNSRKYYVCAFENIEKGGNSWNWVAVFFTDIWFLSHKMYMEFWISSIIGTTLSFCIKSQSLNSQDSLHSIFIIMCLILFVLVLKILLGFYANRLLYYSLKRKIKRGYLLLTSYKSTTWTFIVLIPLSLIIPVLAFLSSKYNWWYIFSLAQNLGYLFAGVFLYTIIISPYLEWMKIKKKLKR